jgi:hypothetical protein
MGFFFFFLGETGVWTQSLGFARQTLEPYLQALSNSS